MRKFIFVLLTLLLVSPFSFAMKGIIWQPQNRDSQVTDTQWQGLMSQLRLQGFDTLVLQWTRYGDAFTQPEQRTLLFKRAAAAQQAGLKLIVGLNADPEFFMHQKQSSAALESYLNRLLAADLQQARLWSAAPGITPDGWYISAEIDDLNWRSEAARQPLLTWLNNAQRLISDVSAKPVYISSFFAGNMSPDGYRQLLEQVGSFFVHRRKLSDLSGYHRCYIVNGKRVLFLLRHSVPHGLEHSGGHSFSRLFPVVNVFLNVPQDSKEHIFDFLYLRFMFPHLLSVQKL